MREGRGGARERVVLVALVEPAGLAPAGSATRRREYVVPMSLFAETDRLRELIEQYREDIQYQLNGLARCAACGDRWMPVEHVRARLAELETAVYITVTVAGIDGPDDEVANARRAAKEKAVRELEAHEAVIERALRR